jgi:L-lactate dehydrogenase complex protein LldG
MSARTEILDRIGQALRDRPANPGVPREYRGPGELDVADQVGLFTERLEDYRASARRCRPGEVAAAVAGCLADQQIERVVVPDGFPAVWLEAVGAAVVRDSPPLGADALDGLDGVVTTCALAIALTGTIVLDAGPGQGRRALSLIPDYHLVVLRSEQIVAGVPDAVRVLDGTRPLTWISGPSATSDIELSRVEGVHGPRRLEVLLVDSGKQGPRV